MDIVNELVYDLASEVLINSRITVKKYKNFKNAVKIDFIALVNDNYIFLCGIVVVMKADLWFFYTECPGNIICGESIESAVVNALDVKKHGLKHIFKIMIAK